ncbi:hypothetical protein VNO80_03928 [Phaseolus coccineus]|uniref:Uncharacterized protein n=1 Tax=Phaseolus coccineus TaxID=3886 RepID=A0AAN9RMZ5_PHACN
MGGGNRRSNNNTSDTATPNNPKSRKRKRFRCQNRIICRRWFLVQLAPSLSHPHSREKFYRIFFHQDSSIVKGRSSGSNNKSGSQHRVEGSPSKSGLTKSSGATIGYNYPSLDYHVCCT